MQYTKRGEVFLSAMLGLFAAGVYAADQPMHQIPSETCKNCHEEIYKQWKGSMHAKSTALSDPIHGAFYNQEVGDPKEEGAKHKASGTYPVCLSCHAPNAARDQKTKLDAMAAYSEGVNCVACHTLKSFKGLKGPDGKLQLGVKAYETADKLQGPEGFSRGAEKLSAAGDMFGGAGAQGEQKPNPHLGEGVEFKGKKIPALTMEANPKQLKTADACMGCHDKRNNPHGVPLCMTGDEYVASKGQVECLSCHMPIADGMANHGMDGGHDSAMLKRAVVFTLDTQAAGDKIKASVKMKNQNPHSLPTGAPFRNMYMKVMAYNKAGEVVWQSSAGHPMQDDPQAYLFFEMVDEQGKPTMPPTAKALGKDTRLKPHEERTLSYDIPTKDVALVRAELYYNLMWASLAEKFKQLPKEDREPMLIAAAERGL